MNHGQFNEIIQRLDRLIELLEREPVEQLGDYETVMAEAKAKRAKPKPGDGVAVAGPKKFGKAKGGG